jgi:hypothetical protein
MRDQPIIFCDELSEDKYCNKYNEDNIFIKIKCPNLPNYNSEHLIEIFQKLDIKQKPEVIQTTYPGSLYRETYDDSKVKVFQRGNITKIYMKPKFKPKCYYQLKRDNINTGNF